MEAIKTFFNLTVLLLVLLGTWYVFSGFETKFFLVLGTISCLFAIAIGWRMTLIDKERHPIYIRWRAPFYFLWLLKAMFVSTIGVTLKVWLPDAKISPVLGWVKSTQKTDESRCVYGNSITLTPGTVCTEIKGKNIQVHTLTESGLADLRRGYMDRKVTESVS